MNYLQTVTPNAAWVGFPCANQRLRSNGRRRRPYGDFSGATETVKNCNSKVFEASLSLRFDRPLPSTRSKRTLRRRGYICLVVLCPLSPNRPKFLKAPQDLLTFEGCGNSLRAHGPQSGFCFGRGSFRPLGLAQSEYHSLPRSFHRSLHFFRLKPQPNLDLR